MGLNKYVTLRLPDMYVGQILDGLNARRDDWLNTLKYLEDGELEEFRNMLECHDKSEARVIVNLYDDIIVEINRQFTTNK
ncbi:MAG: hypothetical protein A2161_07790 [Candidatus Schekmanbacteria bacterium RBG_13_48_7]|uniref:Uncharacterized protein n=1 Tax=Candidatus Schekmanbacteria bacterium RBG_13_48_7 TaxID=1817878 RepID=A0A1F7RZ78_9BACT|nr:MAG: hypothetical protein A2161_07790 [Candidatus Schekmanbacteria bacterium RBG_13_48_7]